MKAVFSQTGLRTLEAFCYSKTLFAFDYDGTLAKIVREPSEALMSRKTARLLENLDKKVPVALISGRSLVDLKGLLTFKPKFTIGNHGMEGLPKTTFSESRALEHCRLWRRHIEGQIPVESGITVEDKKFTLAVHYRKARQKKEAKKRVLEWIGALSPAPRVIMGKHVVNLVPAGAPHKGMALMELMLLKGMTSAVYVGDDDTDEDVFCLPESRIMTIRVGRKRSSNARYFLNQQSEINRLLSQILDFIESDSQSLDVKQLAEVGVSEYVE